MADETLEISREKLFNILSKAFTDIKIEALSFKDEKDFREKIEKIIDKLNHDILEKSKREKPLIKSDERIEIDWG